jgi:hypothetical protein
MAAGGRIGKLQRRGRTGQASELGDLYENLDLSPTIHDVQYS